MTKRNRLPLPESPVFAMRGTNVKWPTLRGAFLDDQKVEALRRAAFGVIFLEGPYNTRLNFGQKSEYTLDAALGRERAVFFEHLCKVDGDDLFLLCWIGNYYAGSIFHCAWQFPQHLNWPLTKLEVTAFRSYQRIARIMYGLKPMDPEVQAFVNRTVSP